MGLEQDGGKVRLTEKALGIGTGFPKQRCLPGTKELLLIPSAAQNQTHEPCKSVLEYLQCCKVRMLCWSRSSLGRILTAEHPSSRAPKGLQHGVTWFTPR